MDTDSLPGQPYTLAVCIIVKNEANNLAACLEPQKDFADSLLDDRYRLNWYDASDSNTLEVKVEDFVGNEARYLLNPEPKAPEGENPWT